MELSAIRERLEEWEEEKLSPFAAKSRHTRGREIPEEESPTRTAFQRDRDRIVHSKSFRRLEHKTQVFIAPLGDHYRTRLTHTLEVAQIARSIARALRLNEDLTEAIALAHDLGHTPFGHIGEESLNEIYPDGFRHNEQSLRVVERLEKGGKGLNLTWEVREGILKHSKVRESILAIGWGTASTLEGQVVKIADGIAYINHDIDDAIRAGIITERDLPFLSISILGETHSQRINTLVCDIIDHCWDRINRPGLKGKRVSKMAGSIIAMSPQVLEAADALREFLFQRVYLDARAKSEARGARNLIHTLYEHFKKDPEDLPSEFFKNQRDESLERIICDYISGMTDRYAIEIFKRIFIPKLWPVQPILTNPT